MGAAWKCNAFHDSAGSIWYEEPKSLFGCTVGGQSSATVTELFTYFWQMCSGSVYGLHFRMSPDVVCGGITDSRFSSIFPFWVLKLHNRKTHCLSNNISWEPKTSFLFLFPKRLQCTYADKHMKNRIKICQLAPCLKKSENCCLVY